MKILRNTKMRFLLMAFVMITGTVMAQDKVNFSGSWMLDLPNSSNPAEDKLKAIVVVQEPEQQYIMITYIIVNSKNVLRAITDTAYMDGMAHTSKQTKIEDFNLSEGKVSVFTRSIISQWSDDGASLAITTNYSVLKDGNPGEFKTVEIWKMEDTGERMIINNATISSRGTENYTYIYNLFKR